MSGLYQYRGAQTIDAEAKHEQAIRQVKEEAQDAIREAYLEVRQMRRDLAAIERKNTKLVAENMVRRESNQRLARLNKSAHGTIGALEVEHDRLRGVIQTLRADKRALQSRIIGLKKVRPERKPKPAPAEVVVQITDYSGPQGLAAAAEEAKRYNKARKAA